MIVSCRNLACSSLAGYCSVVGGAGGGTVEEAIPVLQWLLSQAGEGTDTTAPALPVLCLQSALAALPPPHVTNREQLAITAANCRAAQSTSAKL